MIVEEINQSQKNFVDYFIESANQTEAYKKAYPKCKNDNSAAANASKLLRNTKIKAYLDSRMEEIGSETIASATDVLEYLTKVMRGEEKDQFGLEASLNDRTKAAELLGKRYALFKEEIKHSGSVDIAQTLKEAQQRVKT